MKDDKRKKRKEMQKDMNDIFPEDDILDIITISRYNYHMQIICKMCEPCETLLTEQYIRTSRQHVVILNLVDNSKFYQDYYHE